MAYREAHELEHYQLAEATATVSSATRLRGSFPDDPSLRRHWRRLSRQSSSTDAGQATLVLPLQPSPSIAKVDETMAPEPTTPSVAVVSSRTQVRVTLPTAIVPRVRSGRGKLTAVVPPASTPLASLPLSSPPKPTTTKKKTSFTVAIDGDPTERNQVVSLNGNGTDGEEDDVDLVVDLRAALDAELQSPLSPLRSIKLEPSGCKRHTMGKYGGLTVREPTPPPTEAVSLSPHMLPSGWNAKRPMRTCRLKIKPTHHQHHPQAAVVRKHGFLFVLTVPEDARTAGFAQDEFLRTVVHRQRRRLVTLEDSVLRAFPEDASFPPTISSHALRTIELTDVELRDAPTDSTGDHDVVLHHSFLLVVSSGDTLLLTCASQVDKRQWMHAIRIATLVGKTPSFLTAVAHGSPGSRQLRHRESVAVSLASRELRRASELAGGASGRNAIVVQDDQVLEVEYRIR